jgi:hypothetical protein
MFAWWCLAAVLLQASSTAFILPICSSSPKEGFNVKHVKQQQHQCCDVHKARHQQPRAQRLQLYKKKRKDLLDEDDWYGDGRSSNNDDDPDFRYETYSTFDDSFRTSIDSSDLSDDENGGEAFKFAMVQPVKSSSYSTEPPKSTIVEAPIYYEFDETLTDETDDFDEEQLQLSDSDLSDAASAAADDDSSEDDSDYMSDSDTDTDSDSDDELLQLVGDYALVGAVLYAGERSASDGEDTGDSEYTESDDQIWGSSSSDSQSQFEDVFDSFGFDASSESDAEDDSDDDDEDIQPQFKLWDYDPASLEFAEGEVDPLLTDITGVSLVSQKLQEMVEANYKPSSVPRAATYERVLVSAVSTSIERSLESNLQNFGIDCKINFADFEPDVSDTHWTPEQIAAFKARAVYEATGLPCIAESTSFEVESANGGIGRKDARYRLVQ